MDGQRWPNASEGDTLMAIRGEWPTSKVDELQRWKKTHKIKNLEEEMGSTMR